MPIKAIVDKLDEVPEAYRPLYVQKGEKFEITGIEGLATAADITRLQGVNTNEKNAHALTKAEVASLRSHGFVVKRGTDGTHAVTYQDRPIADVIAELDQIPTLRAAAEGKGTDPARLAELSAPVIAREVANKTAHFTRENKTLGETVATLTADNAKLMTTINNGIVSSAIRDAAAALKMIPEAVGNVVALALGAFRVGEDGKPTTEDGHTVESFLSEKKKDKGWQMFWPAAAGGNARGGGVGDSGGDNPYSHAGWNITNQSKMYAADPAAAERAALAAGHKTAIGARRPLAPK